MGQSNKNERDPIESAKTDRVTGTPLITLLERDSFRNTFSNMASAIGRDLKDPNTPDTTDGINEPVPEGTEFLVFDSPFNAYERRAALLYEPVIASSIDEDLSPGREGQRG